MAERTAEEQGGNIINCQYVIKTAFGYSCPVSGRDATSQEGLQCTIDLVNECARLDQRRRSARRVTTPPHRKNNF